MIESHPESEAWEVHQEREALQHRLYSSHSQNQRLNARLQQLEISIADYAQKIGTLKQKWLVVEEENTRLKAELKSKAEEVISLNRSLQSRNEQYCALYNYLFTERHDVMHEAFIKQLHLNSTLTEIQHESDASVIKRLKALLQEKNEALIKSAQRISELNEALSSSTLEYQEQISMLRYQNTKYRERQGRGEPTRKEDWVEYSSRNKIEGLQRQIALYKEEVSASREEINRQINYISDIEKANVGLQSELRLIKSHLPTLDKNVYEVITQNARLKIDVDDYRFRYEELVRSIPTLQKRHFQLNQFLTARGQADQQLQKINKLEGQLEQMQKRCKLYEVENKQFRQEKASLESKLISLQLASASAFDKLKKLISTYAPHYYKMANMGLYTLEEEEKEFLVGLNVETTLVEVKSQIQANISEISKLRQAKDELQKSFKLTQSKLDSLQKEGEGKDNQIKLLSTALQQLIQNQKTTQIQKTSVPIEIRSDSESEDAEQFFPAESNGASNQHADLEQSHRSRTINSAQGESLRGKVLEAAIQDLQKDRNQLVGIIQDKDRCIVELTAELNMAKKIPTFRPFSIQQVPTKPLYSSSEVPISDPASTRYEIQEVRKQLRQMLGEFQTQRQLMAKEKEQSEAEHIRRYMGLLKQYNQMAAKCKQLEESQKQVEKPIPMEEEEQHEEVGEVQHHEINLQNDQSGLSESVIQNFTDILKRYERQLAKYVTIYETQIKKALEKSNPIEGLAYPEQSQQMARLQTIISSHSHTIEQLKRTLDEKVKGSQLQIEQLQQLLAQANKSRSEVAMELQEANKALQGLKSQVLEKSFSHFVSSQSANSTFMLLDMKNKQLAELKSSYDRLKKEHDSRCLELVRALECNNQPSQLQAEEYKLFRQIVGEQDLVGILQEAADRLGDEQS